ncbi:TerD family protein [Spirulina major CS-329]|jgi:tellurium resistance protein TerD|uniref:TerD family protein n=1 Tax=Spirulina TaxID=1154 RepID=UPI00232E6CCB|nr:MULTISPECIES: TerD family protein [Spirulina]MDB9496483.1 TerD family protein [Spirulina subsalsa CS-330]MDB9504736.1 TerD family protein [Spirulina major CS-329]
MTINLSKGQGISLAKAAPGLKSAWVGLGWDVSASTSAFDLDTSVFLLGANGKLVSDQHFIFYNNLKSPDGAVEHYGDNRTGQGSGDDETIEVNLARVDAAIEEMIFVVTIHEAVQRSQNFGQVKNAFIRIADANTEAEVTRYELDEDFSTETSLEFGRLYRQDGSWQFQAVGKGYTTDLGGFLAKYN